MTHPTEKAQEEWRPLGAQCIWGTLWFSAGATIILLLLYTHIHQHLQRSNLAHTYNNVPSFYSRPWRTVVNDVYVMMLLNVFVLLQSG